jgi:hypothetical protein
VGLSAPRSVVINTLGCHLMDAIVGCSVYYTLNLQYEIASKGWQMPVDFL